MIAILKKELRTALREKTGWALLLSMPVLFAIFSFFTVGATYRAEELSACDAGRRLLGVGLTTWMYAMMALLPVLSAVNLVREGDRKTLEVLLVSPRTGVEMGAAKLLSPALIACLSCLMTFPLLMALPLLGGVRPWEPLAGLAAAMLTAIVSSAVGMAVGATMRGTAGSVVGAGLASWMMGVGTTWALFAPGTGLAGAAFPLGVVRLILQGDGLTVFGAPLPLLLPSMLLMPLVTGCFFFLSLSAITTPYRRQALPTRAFALSATALFAVFGLLSVPDSNFNNEIHNIITAMLCLASVIAPALLIVDRIDTEGTVRTVPGTAEDELVARGGPLLQLASSRAGLALLPLVAILPASGLMLARASRQGVAMASVVDFVLVAHVYVLCWSLFCLGVSYWLPRRNRPLLEATVVQLIPFLIGQTILFTGATRAEGLSGPIQVITLIGQGYHGSASSSFQVMVANTVVMMLAAGGALVLGFFLERRRAGGR